MKQLALVAALALPMMANAVPLANNAYALNGLKNSVTTTSKGICFGAVEFKGKGTITQSTIGFDNKLFAILSIGTKDTPTDGVSPPGTFAWESDYLLDNDFNGPVGNVTLNGIITARKGDTLTLNFAPADQLTLATSLLTYAVAFPEQLENAVLDPNSKPKNSPPAYQIIAKFTKGGNNVKVTETSYIVSNQGPCTTTQKQVRKFTGTHTL